MNITFFINIIIAATFHYFSRHHYYYCYCYYNYYRYHYYYYYHFR